MDYSCSWYILPAAFILDLYLGDPKLLPHPIPWMGKAITTTEPFFRELPIRRTLSGAFFSASLVISTWILTYFIIHAARIIHPLFSNILKILLIYYAVSIRSLEDYALEVYRALKLNRLPEARTRLAAIVGRDVEDLKKDGVVRGAVESVAENLVDGVISPLFYAAIGGAPLAMAYKMVNTLDSMIGYKNDTYLHFGKVAARIDDMANFIPARLSVPIIAFTAQMLVGRGWPVWHTAVAEGANHASPNAGYPEAAFSGALQVRLGGPNYYGGQLVSKPYLGIRFGQANPNHIKKACDLMMLSALIWLMISWTIWIII